MHLHLAAPKIYVSPWIYFEHLGNRVLHHDDPLEVGRLAPLSHGFWLRRLEFAHAYSRDQCPADLRLSDEVLLDALEGVDRVCLWLTDHLADQIFAALYVSRLADAGWPVDRVEVALAGSRMNGVSLHMASFNQRPHHGPPLVRRPLELAEWHALQRCWQALTSPTPEPLLAFLADGARQGLPHHDSLQTLIGHFPSRTSGLDVWEERLLGILARWSPRAVKSASVLGAYLGEHDNEADAVGDLFLFQTLLGLDQVACPVALVESTGERIAMRFVTLRLTDFGREVLEGRANHLEHNPIDRWVAGVHLDSAASRVWVRDGDTLVPWIP